MLMRLKPSAFLDYNSDKKQYTHDAPTNYHLGLSISDRLVFPHGTIKKWRQSEARRKPCRGQKQRLRQA